MKRWTDWPRWIGSQPLRSFEFRLFLYLLLLGSLPVFAALAFFYLHAAERSEIEWRALVDRKHEQVQRRLEREIRELEYTYAMWLQHDALGFWRRAVRDGREDSDTSSAAREAILSAASLQLDYRRHLSDICFVFEGSGSLCTNGAPFTDETDPARMPANRNDFFVLRESPNRLSWIGPIYDPANYVTVGFIKIAVNMFQLMEEIRQEQSVPYLALWEPDDGDALFESGKRELLQHGSAAVIRSESEAFLRSEDGVLLSQRPVTVAGQSWMLYLELPNTDLRELQATLRNTILVFVAGMLALSTAGSLVFAKLFARPLRLLRQLMKRAESGDLKAYWTYGSIRDIDELGNSYNQMLNRLEETIKQVKREESLKKEAEIEALQYQLNPHFLYNTLNTIKWVAKIHKTPQIAEAVSALVRLLQASLGKKGDFISLKEEVGLVRDYMAIQAFRYGDDVAVRYEIDPLAELCLVPKMMLQPLVENALVHGLEQRADNGEIMIRAWLDRDMLLCEVSDNGKGMEMEKAAAEGQARSRSESSKERLSGIGLSNIRERIKLYYGPDYNMHVISKPRAGTTIRLLLPIHRIEENEA